MKQGDAKELQNIFRSNLNRISKGRFESKEKKRALKNIKLLFESRQDAIKLFNDYSSIASEAKYKVKHGEGHPLDLATQLKILSPKQMLQRLPIALAQVKAGNTS